MKKIRITLEGIDHDFLISCLEKYLEGLTDAGKIRTVAKLIDTLDNDFEEVD